MAKQKICTRCKRMKPIDAYGTNGNRGRHARCLACRAEDDGQRYQDPERFFNVKARDANRRAIALGVSGIITREQLMSKLAQQNNQCYWCARELDDGCQVDHIKPLGTGYRDGDNSPGNVCISCPQCNRSKSDLPVNVWLGILASRGIRHELYTGKHYQQPLFEISKET